MTFLQNYLSQFNLDSILTTVFNKLLSLVLLYIVFFITKKLVKLSVKKLLTPSLKLARQDQGRQKTITRLVENILNYALYFILIYWVLSILGLSVSSLLAGAGIAGVAIGLGAQGFLSDLVNGFFILIEHQFDVCFYPICQQAFRSADRSYPEFFNPADINGISRQSL